MYLKEILWAGFEIFINLFQAALFFVVITKYFEPKYEKKKAGLILILFILLFAAVVTAINITVMLEHFLGFLYIILIFVYALIALKGNIWHKLLVSLGELFLSFTVVWVTLNIVSSIAGMSHFEIAQPVYGLPRLGALLMIQPLMAYILAMVLRVKRNINYTWQQWIYIFVVPALSVIQAFCVSKMAAVSIGNGIRVFAIVCVLLAVGMNVSTILLMFSYEKQNKYMVEANKLAGSYEEKVRVISENLADREELREIRHDLKYHLMALKMHLEQDDLNGIQEYIKVIDRRIDNIQEYISFTENKVLNYILNDEWNKARKLGVCIEFDIQGEFDWISEFDLVRVFGNLLDNAIEHAAKCRSKYVNLKAKCTYTAMSLSVQNCIDDSVLTHDSQLRTSKEDKRKHGHGLNSIMRVVKEYRGRQKIYELDGMFCHDIVIDRFV